MGEKVVKITLSLNNVWEMLHVVETSEPEKLYEERILWFLESSCEGWDYFMR